MDELLIEPEPTERELGTAPIKPLFARYAAITFAGMLAQMVMVVLEGLIIGNGLPCTVIGHSERGLERCRKSIEQNWDDLIAEGLATEGNKQAAMALVTITNDPAALQEHTFVFEAVAEGTEEKRAVYETIEQNAAPNVVIASCTSSIDAEILAGLVSHPERLLIAHPFQPVHMLPLVEVVRHEKTRRHSDPYAGAAGDAAPAGSGAEPQCARLPGEPFCPGAVPGVHLPH